MTLLRVYVKYEGYISPMVDMSIYEYKQINLTEHVKPEAFYE